MTKLLFSYYENKKIVAHLHRLDLLYMALSHNGLVDHLLYQYH